MADFRQKMESKALVMKIFCSLVDTAHGLWLEGCESGPKPEVERSARFFARFRKLTSDSRVASARWHAHNCCLRPSLRPFYAHIGIGVPEPTDACYFGVLPMDKRSTPTRDRRRPTRRLGVIGGIRPGFTLTPQTSRATSGTQRALPIANIRFRMRSDILV